MAIMHWHVGTFSRKGDEETSSFLMLFPEMQSILSAKAKEEGAVPAPTLRPTLQTHPL